MDRIVSAPVSKIEARPHQEGGSTLFSGEVALVTGASRGIGRAIAVKLAEQGADIGLVQRGTAGDTVASIRQHGRRALVVQADLADFAAAERAVDEVSDYFGRLDVVVCNAGVTHRQPALDVSLEDWRRVIEINLIGTFVVSRAAARRFITQGTGGRIVHVSSTTGLVGSINVSAYAASKGAIIQLTKAQASEWASLGIRVNAVAPGWVETEMTEAVRSDVRRSADITARIPAGRWGTPEAIAKAVVFLASPEAEYVHGATLLVDGGYLVR